MLLKTAAVLSLSGLLIATPGCFRLTRASMRASRPNPRNNQPTPEQMRISTAELDAASVKILNQERAKWSELCVKYNCGDLRGAAQIAAVCDAINNAHWSEKPQVENLAAPLGAAIGDALRAHGDVNWVLAEGDTVCLVSGNGKVAVAPVAIAETWVAGKKHPFDELRKEVARAVRETTGEPVLIGFDEVYQADPAMR